MIGHSATLGRPRAPSSCTFVEVLAGRVPCYRISYLLPLDMRLPSEICCLCPASTAAPDSPSPRAGYPCPAIKDAGPPALPARSLLPSGRWASLFVAMYVSLEEIASWPTPDYVHPVTRGPGLIVMHLVLYPVILALVALRTYTRLRISRSFGLDDVFILLAMACPNSCCQRSLQITRGSFPPRRLSPSRSLQNSGMAGIAMPGMSCRPWCPWGCGSRWPPRSCMERPAA